MNEEQNAPAPQTSQAQEKKLVTPVPKEAGKGSRKGLIIAIVILFLFLVGGASFFFGRKQSQAEPTPTPTPSEAPTPSPEPEETPTPTPSPTPSPTPKPTPTPTPLSFQVTSVVAAAAVPGGSCPQTVNFSANITTNAAGSVEYKWERSDDAGAPTQSLTFASAETKTVNTTWQLGASYSGWERVHILTPNDLTSNNADFSVNCP